MKINNETEQNLENIHSDQEQEMVNCNGLCSPAVGFYM